MRGEYRSTKLQNFARGITELIPTVEMETSNPVESYFDIVNFRRSVIIAELWRPGVARRYKLPVARAVSTELLGFRVSFFLIFFVSVPCAR